jgi:hypothetical protein
VKRSMLSTSSAHTARLACCAVLACSAGSCGSDRTLTAFCTAPASLSVIVAVRDSITGQAAVGGATGTLVGASVDDTLHQVDSLQLAGGDQTGTFTVQIDRPGYLAWSASGVRVTEVGPCGNVIPVQLSARLQPASP